MTPREINTVDLFCGAGGATTGLELALERLGLRHKGLAINHWRVAVDTMTANHPDVDTKQMSIEEAVPADLVPGGRVDFLWASPSCFTAGHLVTTARGQVPIEDVQVGDVVLTHRLRWRRVVRKQCRGNAKTIVVQGAGHFGIECTPQHQFWLRPSFMDGRGREHPVREYGVPQWMPIGRALANEALWATPAWIDERLPALELPAALAGLADPWYVIGRWIGDGHSGSGRHHDTCICCPHGQTEFLARVLSGPRKWAYIEKRTVSLFTLTDSETYEWLTANFGRGAEGKQIPSWCLTMSHPWRDSLFRGYLDADGYTKQRRNQCCTVSRALAVSLRLLAESLGFRVGMSYDDKRLTYCIEGRTGVALPQYRLHWNATLSPLRAAESFQEEGVVWSRVRKMREGRKNATVYNIEVEEDHSYVLDGIIVKNCTHHSRALGGKPRANQLRAQPELILTWLDQLFVRRLCVENVPEFVEWGPLSAAGRPIEARKGACFRAWIAALEARNYTVDWRVLNCADYGDATTRRRFFLQAVRRGCGKIVWPEPEYAEDPQPTLFGPPLKKWRGIRECLDLSDTGTSIFNRDRPLAENTLRRVFVGLRKYCGLDFQMDFLGADGPDEPRLRSTEAPLATQPAGGNRTALVRSFLVRFNRHGDAESIDKPLSVVAAGGQHHALASAFIVRNNRGCFAEDADRPLSSQQASTVHHALCTPIVLDHFKNGEARPTDEPVGSQTTHDRFSVVQAFAVDMSHPGDENDGGRVTDGAKPLKTATARNNTAAAFIVTDQAHNAPRSADKPIRTQTAVRKDYVVQPFVMNNNAHNVPRSLEKPMHAVTTGNHAALVQPFVVGQNGGSAPHSVDDPCQTITTTSRGIRVLTPLVLGQQSGAECRPADKPCPTVATAGSVRVVAPIVVDMSRPSGPDSGHINSSDEPIRTITTFDNLQGCFLMTEDGRIVDVRMRMLKPSELAAAHSFPKDYKLTGNRTEQVKQIGNSVPCRTAAALCEAALSA